MNKTKQRIAAGVLAVNTLFTAGCSSVGNTLSNKDSKESKVTINVTVDEDTQKKVYELKTEDGKIIIFDEDNLGTAFDYVDGNILVVSTEDGNSLIFEKNNLETALQYLTFGSQSSTDAIEGITTEDEELTTENFEQVVANYYKIVNEAGLNITIEDLTKFVAIINIDKLAEENPTFARELFSVQQKEEFLNDFLKVCSVIADYNSDLYFTNGNTEEFVMASPAVIGSQREKLEYFEGYIDKVAKASMNGDSDEVNRLAEELITNVNEPTSEYSYLDDGVGMGLYLVIESLLSTVSRDSSNNGYLNDMNTNRLTILSYCEKYISNVFAVYEECQSQDGDLQSAEVKQSISRQNKVRRLVKTVYDYESNTYTIVD